jgi:fatty-acid peroxygenase
MAEGYGFVSKRCARYHSPVFVTRLLLQRTICLCGPEAVGLFYDEHRFVRRHAAPRRLQGVLLGKGGVQGLDGRMHRVRKALFVDLLGDDRIEPLVARFEQLWLQALPQWARQSSLALLPAVENLLCQAVCAWAGVPLKESELALRSRQMAAMIDGAGRLGPAYLKARMQRRAVERWAADLIRQCRHGDQPTVDPSPLQLVAHHRDADGALMDPRTAAVELLNLLRPTVAVARFVAFAALELERLPIWRQRLAADDACLKPFAQEVRRLYAFFPAVAARVKEDFTWHGYRFEKDVRVLLDLFGSNRDPGTWTSSDEFLPERYAQAPERLDALVTQGSGTYREHHRCPGEPLTIALLVAALKLLSRRMSYRLRDQGDLVSLRRMPMLPRDSLVVREVKPLPAAG